MKESAYARLARRYVRRADRTGYEAAGTVALSAKAGPGPTPVLWATLAGDALVSAPYDNGYWVRLPNGSYRNGSRRTMP